MDAEDLIRPARDGEQAAMGEPLADNRPRPRHMAERGLSPRLKAKIDATDLAQQTCLSGFRRIAGFEGRDAARFAAWLCRMHERNIGNAVRDPFKTEKRGDGREQRLDGRDLQAGGRETPSRQAIRHEEAGRLAAALERSPDDERAAVRLRFLDGRTLADVGGELGLTKDGVVWLLQKGMKRLEPWPAGGDGRADRIEDP